MPISITSPEREVDLGLVPVGCGCDGEGASSQAQDRQQNQGDGAEGSAKQLPLSPRLEKGHEGERQQGCTE